VCQWVPLRLLGHASGTLEKQSLQGQPENVDCQCAECGTMGSLCSHSRPPGPLAKVRQGLPTHWQAGATAVTTTMYYWQHAAQDYVHLQRGLGAITMGNLTGWPGLGGGGLRRAAVEAAPRGEPHGHTRLPQQLRCKKPLFALVIAEVRR
jgi:hypothetical protein